MRRKRLQHAADTLCHMFCGWRLFDSYPELERLGSGTVCVDAITEACTFNDRPIPPLGIAGELAAWLRDDLAAHHIDIAAIQEARLEAELHFGTVSKQERRTRDAHFDRQGHHLVPPQFISCEIRCRSRVVTNEVTYTSEYRDLEEWPSGWPQR